MLYGKIYGDAPKISLHGTQAAFLHGGIIGMIRILFICHGRSQSVSLLAAFGG